MTISPQTALKMGFVRTPSGNWLPPEAVQTPKSKQNSSYATLGGKKGHLEASPAADIKPDGSNSTASACVAAAPSRTKAVGVQIIMSGQIRGGKNNMIVTRTGLHFPKPEWAAWRDEKVSEVKAQLPPCFTPNGKPVNVRLNYVAGDKRRRDMPAILDSIFHVLEKAGFVTDDSLIWVTESSRSYDKTNPRCVITVLQ